MKDAPDRTLFQRTSADVERLLAGNIIFFPRRGTKELHSSHFVSLV